MSAAESAKRYSNPIGNPDTEKGPLLYLVFIWFSIRSTIQAAKAKVRPNFNQTAYCSYNFHLEKLQSGKSKRNTKKTKE